MSETTHTRLRIIIVEDDSDASENLRDILELDEHQVTLCGSAEAAFREPDLPRADVILLDWKLPDGSALEILPRLTGAAPEADVVIITGYGDFERAVSALRQGAADYLLKPINPDVLRTSIKRLSQRRWLQREKARSDELFRHLVEAAPSLILILRLDLTVVYFSPYSEQVTGYRAAEVEGRTLDVAPLKVVLCHDWRKVVDELFQRGELTGRELEIQCRDGSRRWISWNARALQELDGEPAVLAVGQDVTDQKQAVEKLVQSERLAAIGEAMTGLAHESRNALQRSQAYLELLASELGGQSDCLELVGQIQKAQNHLHQLYEEVRQYAAPLRINSEQCLLKELIEETWTNLSAVHKGRDAQLTIVEKSPARTCACDRFMIEQVFRNILENSLAACTDP